MNAHCCRAALVLRQPTRWLCAARQARTHAVRRNASSASSASTSATATSDLDNSSFFDSSAGINADPEFDPAGNARRRTTQLPRSRDPEYYRGPLHPHQPLPRSDPNSREFVPGPFSVPRLEQTYHSTITSDLMTLTYNHHPPGFEAPVRAPQLRSWGDSTPYLANRPPRGPRGSNRLRLQHHSITNHNIPKIEEVVLHSFVRAATDGSPALHVAGMALQSISGVKPEFHEAHVSDVTWRLRKGTEMSLTCRLKGEAMYHFLSKMIDVVLPRIRDWKGVAGTSGDDNGNITFGMTPTTVAFFPEIEINYDSYPQRMVPGMHVHIKTSAVRDREARLLLMAMGVPFYGKMTR